MKKPLTQKSFNASLKYYSKKYPNPLKYTYYPLDFVRAEITSAWAMSKSRRNRAEIHLPFHVLRVYLIRHPRWHQLQGNTHIWVSSTGSNYILVSSITEHPSYFLSMDAKIDSHKN